MGSSTIKVIRLQDVLEHMPKERLVVAEFVGAVQRAQRVAGLAHSQVMELLQRQIPERWEANGYRKVVQTDIGTEAGGL